MFKVFYAVHISLICNAWLYRLLSMSDSGCSESMWRKLCRSVCVLYISVSSFLFLICSSVSRKEILVFKFFYSSSIELGFVFNSPKFRISCSLLPVHTKNISSMKPKELNEIPCKNRDMYFLSKWSINILSYDSAEILSMGQPFIFVELQLNKKSFNARIDYGKVVITFVTIAFQGKLSSYAFAAFILSLII